MGSPRCDAVADPVEIGYLSFERVIEIRIRFAMNCQNNVIDFGERRDLARVVVQRCDDTVLDT